jgi:hypothetical protein
VAGRPVDLAELAARVPLVAADDGPLRIHQLWEEIAPRLFPQDDVRRVRRRALAVLRARGETVRAGWCALRWGDAEALAGAARALVRDTLGALPSDTAERWLAGVGAASDGSVGGAGGGPADLELLRLAVRHARRATDPALDGEIDALARRYADQGDAEGQSVALALATVVAHFAGDLGRLFELAGRVRALPGAEREPVLRLLVGAVDAALATLQGDADADRRAPYNLYAFPEDLRAAGDDSDPDAGAPPALFTYRDEGTSLDGPGTEPVDGYTTEAGATGLTTTIRWNWDAPSGTWQRTQDGTPHVDDRDTRVSTSNVIVRFTPYRDSGVRDSVGAAVPEAVTTGDGDAWLLGDGRLQRARWQKPSDDAPTTYTATDGSPLRLTPGPTWVEVLPPGTGDVLPAAG